MTFRKQGLLFIPTRNILVPRKWTLRDNRGFISPAIIGAMAASRRRGGVSATIAVDAVNTGNAQSASSKTWSHTCTGSDLVLIVWVRTTTQDYTSGVKYNDEDLIKAYEINYYGTVSHSMWYLVDPATGTHDVEATFGGSDTYIEYASVSFTGVNQSTPFRGSAATSNGVGTSSSVTISSAVGDMVVDSLSSSASTTGQTLLFESTFYGYDLYGSRAPGAASVTMDWAVAGGNYWAMGAVSLIPA